MKTINPVLVSICLIFALSACSGSSEPKPKTPSKAIVVFVENGGTVKGSDQEMMRTTVLHLLEQITALGKRKATRDTQVHIVLSALPNRISWSGSARQLSEQSEAVKALITFKPSFSDLVVSFDQIETTISLTLVDQVRLYWIGPVVHVPFQDTGDAIKVDMPQAIPEALALPAFADKLTTLRVLNIHPDQDEMLHAYLTKHGIFKRVRDGSLDFALLGAAQTKAHLPDLL